MVDIHKSDSVLGLDAGVLPSARRCLLSESLFEYWKCTPVSLLYPQAVYTLERVCCRMSCQMFGKTSMKNQYSD